MDLDRAFEPDESYYIAHADEIRPQDEVDLLLDPPPDLVTSLIDVFVARRFDRGEIALIKEFRAAIGGG